MKQFVGTILMILFISDVLTSQKSSLNFVNEKNRIYVDFKNGTDIFYPVDSDKGISVYQLAKTFQIEEKKIYAYNGLKDKSVIKSGSIIQVPVIRKKVTFKPLKNQRFVVLVYKIKARETLFHIANRKMQMDLEVLKKINGLTDDQVREGGELILGWYPLEDAKEDKKTGIPAKSNPSPSEKPIAVKKPVEEVKTMVNDENKPEVIIRQKRMIGYWDKNARAKKGLFVLSNVTPVGSKMELTYPMNRNKIVATVVGKIPEGTYADDVEIYLSPEVAAKLGIHDSRFSLDTRFIVPAP